MKLLLVCGLFAGLCGCGADVPSSPDVTGDVVSKAGLGQACVKNSDCATGLCMQSDYTTFPLCTAFCDAPLEACDKAATGASALCVEMPADFNGPTKPFCAPVCADVDMCKVSDSRWETCSKLSYKNERVPGYADKLKVCGQPSANGKPTVDPLTCKVNGAKWEGYYTDPKVQAAKSTCADYCNFLIACQLFDTKAKSTDCCTYGCFLKLAPSGTAVKAAERTNVQCFSNSYSAHRNTGQVCTAYKTQCGVPYVP